MTPGVVKLIGELRDENKRLKARLEQLEATECPRIGGHLGNDCCCHKGTCDTQRYPVEATVQRYQAIFDGDSGCMDKAPDGYWVRYSDYAYSEMRHTHRIKQLEAALRFYADPSRWAYSPGELLEDAGTIALAALQPQETQ